MSMMAISSAVGSFCVELLLGLKISLLILWIGLAGVILSLLSSLMILPVSFGMCGTLMPYADVLASVDWLSFSVLLFWNLFVALEMM